jgi:hypothetical protein
VKKWDREEAIPLVPTLSVDGGEREVSEITSSPSHLK